MVLLATLASTLANIAQFDLRFTKGNSVIMPEKLGFLQRKYTEKYIREGGCKFDSMIGQVCAVAEQETRDHPRYEAHKP